MILSVKMSAESEHCVRVYLDNNATTPYAREVRECIMAAMEDAWANPSCGYEEGKRARKVVEEARAKVAKSIGCADKSEVVFTSGGTEANNWVFHCLRHGSCESAPPSSASSSSSSERPAPVHVVSTTIEHPSVALPLTTLCQDGRRFACSLVAPDPATGAVRPDDVIAALTPRTRLVSVMLANNETGVVQPLAEIGRALRLWADRTGCPCPALHSDAAQALGKIPVVVGDLGVDLLTIAGHKFYGPRVGALYCRRGSPLKLVAWMEGGGQEGGLRSGTENTAMIAGLGRACQLVTDDVDGVAARNMHATCTQLRRGLQRALGADGVVFNCAGEEGDPARALGEDGPPPVDRLPNTCSVGVVRIPAACTGRDVLARCRSVVAGVGSACHFEQDLSDSERRPVDTVLTRSGVAPSVARCTLRLSTGRYTSSDDITVAVDDITQAVHRLQREHGVRTAS